MRTQKKMKTEIQSGMGMGRRGQRGHTTRRESVPRSVGYKAVDWEKRRQAAALQDAGAVARDASATRRQARLEAK